MKRLLVGLLLLLSLSVFAPLTSAIGEGGIQDMARYFGEDYELFFAIRTDDLYVSEINSIVNTVISKLPPELASSVPSEIDLRSFISLPIENQVYTYEDIRGVLGDSFAFGARSLQALDGGTPKEGGFMLAVEIKDRAALETALNLGSLNAIEASAFSLYTLPNGTLALTDDLLMFAADVNTLPAIFTGLEATEKYQSAIGALPAESYNILLYANLENALEVALADAPAELLVSLEQLPNVFVLGATILDGKSLAIDIAADTALLYAPTPISTSFAQNLPNGTDLLVHSTDLGKSVQALLEQIDTQFPAGADQPSPATQIRQALSAFVGLNLEEDLLSWTTGDYALFASSDVRNLFATFADNGTSSLATLNLELGFVQQATDPAKAANLVTRLKNLVALANTNQTTETRFTSADYDQNGTVGFTVGFPIEQTNETLDLVFASNDRFFYVGTLNALERILAGDTLDKDAILPQASAYFLPNAYSVAYTDDDGWVDFAGIIGAGIVSGPTINNVFENIQSELSDETPAPAPDPSDEMANSSRMFLSVLDAVKSLIAHSSISTAVTEFGAVARMIITFK